MRIKWEFENKKRLNYQKLDRKISLAIDNNNKKTESIQELDSIFKKLLIKE